MDWGALDEAIFDAPAIQFTGQGASSGQRMPARYDEGHSAAPTERVVTSPSQSRARGAGTRPAATQPPRHVLQQLDDEKSRLRSIERGMTALVERATAVPVRYASAQESIRKTLRRRGPSLHLTKVPPQRTPLYPRSHAVAGTSYGAATQRAVQHMGAGFESTSLDVHVEMQQQAMQRSFDESYELHRWVGA
ncbi:hypothetical protein GPECTOR_19g283 [Gonium pectorale]|uniref:Uncharacterized protein n=1 Tax=Gonium pectorale TaxID=33097 RepID=A0A150GJ43_GONPE|nr:hypothetical protein GPECTOR_19g283 [Gonium pectorale]|eukprot:KXZ49832.1 hypothetical protein GPECTOR_19g283 [Gonium pectorale]